MNAVFSILFKADLDAETERYRAISERLASALKERVAGQVRKVIKWQGGDHVAPHGFPCRRATPFPFYICYSLKFFLSARPPLPGAPPSHPGNRKQPQRVVIARGVMERGGVSRGAGSAAARRALKPG